MEVETMIDYILLGPEFSQFTLKQAVDALEKLPLTVEEKQKIRFDNAQRLLFLGRNDLMGNVTWFFQNRLFQGLFCRYTFVS